MKSIVLLFMGLVMSSSAFGQHFCKSLPEGPLAEYEEFQAKKAVEQQALADGMNPEHVVPLGQRPLSVNVDGKKMYLIFAGAQTDLYYVTFSSACEIESVEAAPTPDYD